MAHARLTNAAAFRQARNLTCRSSRGPSSANNSIVRSASVTLVRALVSQGLRCRGAPGGDTASTRRRQSVTSTMSGLWSGAFRRRTCATWPVGDASRGSIAWLMVLEVGLIAPSTTSARNCSWLPQAHKARPDRFASGFEAGPISHDGRIRDSGQANMTSSGRDKREPGE